MPAWALLAFDLDGTLADTESFSVPNLLELFATHYGLQLTAAQWYANYHGMSGPSLLAKINAEHGTQLDWTEFAPRRQAALEAVIRDHGIEPMPGVFQMLRRTVACGQQIALVSNSNPTRIALTLEYINGQRQHGVLLPALFAGHIFSGTDPAHPTRASKPAPDVYVAAAAFYQAAPAQCLALEDSVAGARAAVAAGFTCWGYTGAATEPDTLAENLRAAGASHIIAHWDDFRLT